MIGIKQIIDFTRFRKPSITNKNFLNRIAGLTANKAEPKSAPVFYTPPINAPGTQINYDKDLVARLKRDHSALLEIYGKMIDSAKRGDGNKVIYYTAQFKSAFNAHALTEYTKLYIFLDYALKYDEEYHAIIMEFRKEMNTIGKVVREFCSQWINTNFTPNHFGHYLQEASAIGSVLQQRITTEEERLYEIYDLVPNILAGTGQTGY